MPVANEDIVFSGIRGGGFRSRFRRDVRPDVSTVCHGPPDHGIIHSNYFRFILNIISTFFTDHNYENTIP
jgi:hypothetical protein